MISQILKMLMFKKDIRTTQLAREINVPQQTLQRIVAGFSPSPHRKTLAPLAEYFLISVDQLTGKKPLPDELATANVAQGKSTVTQQQIPLIATVDVERFIKDRDSSLIKGNYSRLRGASSRGSDRGIQFRVISLLNKFSCKRHLNCN